MIAEFQDGRRGMDMKIRTEKFSVLVKPKDGGYYLNIFHKLGRHWEGFITQLTKPQARILYRALYRTI